MVQFQWKHLCRCLSFAFVFRSDHILTLLHSERSKLYYPYCTQNSRNSTEFLPIALRMVKTINPIALRTNKTINPIAPRTIKTLLTLLHSEWSKFHRVFTVLSAVVLKGICSPRSKFSFKVPCLFVYKTGLPFQHNQKHLDPSCLARLT